MLNPFPNRSEIRAAVKSWRQRHPDMSVTVRNDGWYGWILWSTTGEAGPVARMENVINEYRASIGEETTR